MARAPGTSSPCSSRADRPNEATIRAAGPATPIQRGAHANRVRVAGRARRSLASPRPWRSASTSARCASTMMANMPPQRFNYQQRVGRAGRSGQPFSYALTLCRDRSHDDVLLPARRPHDRRHPAAAVPRPWQARIVQRVVAAEFLRRGRSCPYRSRQPGHPTATTAPSARFTTGLAPRRDQLTMSRRRRTTSRSPSGSHRSLCLDAHRSRGHHQVGQERPRR